MGYTLDQLLDATGLDDLSGSNLTKQAAAPPEQNLSKLAEELRRASEVSHDEVDSTELVEKTAAVAVLERTLQEIAAIDNPHETEKTAAPSGVKARFIKEALEAGHSPVEIAAFLEKESSVRDAIGGAIGRGFQRLRTSRAIRKSEKAQDLVARRSPRALGEAQEMLRQSAGLSAAKRDAVLGRLRARLGDERLNTVLQTSGVGGYKNLETAKIVRKSVAAEAAKRAPKKGPGYAASAQLGGKTVGLTKKQVKAIKGPAAYGAAGIAGGAAISRRGDSKPSASGSGRGPVIIAN